MGIKAAALALLLVISTMAIGGCAQVPADASVVSPGRSCHPVQRRDVDGPSARAIMSPAERCVGARAPN